jgi:DNA-binding FadR family transcriptional regulator
VAATHNPILIRFHEGLVLAIKNNTNLFEFLTQDAKLADQIVNDHRRLLKAIEKKDVQLAGQIARQHLLGSMARHEEYASPGQ